MKKILSILLFLLPVLSYAQEQVEMPSRTIYVSFDKIKHIVLSAEVSDIHFGRMDYLVAEIVEAAPNIVRITAQQESFDGETNLTIICQDGSVHVFRVLYLPKEQADDNIIYSNQGKYQSTCYKVSVDNSHETSMFFPADIIYCRQGNEDVFGIEYYNNIIKMGTTFEDYPQSNLFVVDADLNCYEITLECSKAQSYSYNFDNERKYIAHIDVNSIEMYNLISKMRIKSRNIYSIGVIKNKFEMSLSNLYVYKDYMFFAFYMSNYSNIDYDIDFIKCFQRDQKKLKNAIQQEIEMDPVYTKDFNNKIAGKSEKRFILVFNKFTIPDNKIFEIEMFEKGGGRHFKLAIQNEYILRAELLK